jgi:CBS domain-containing protein
MKIREVMTHSPQCCYLSDLSQTVAQMLRDEDIGAMPVLSDRESRRLEGIITDRDLCCSIISAGLDPRTTRIEAFVSRSVITCRPEQSLDSCQKLMQIHQVRRILVVDSDAHCVGIVSQADLARSEDSQEVHRTIGENLQAFADNHGCAKSSLSFSNCGSV